MARDLRPRAVLAELWRERPIWIAYLVVIAIWGAGYIHSRAYSGSSLGGVTVGQYLTYFRILWLQTLIPSLASVTIPASNLDPPQVLFVVASQIVVLVCVGVSVRRKRAAWRAWAFLAVIVLLDGGLVARSRVAQFGVAIANDPRYLIDFAWLVPLALCAAFARGQVLTPAVPDRDARLALPSSRTLGAVLASATLIVYAGGSVATAAQLQRDWPGSHSRSWERHVRRDVAQLRRSSRRFVIADNATPFFIMEPFVAPYNRLSRVLNLYVGPVRVDGPLDGPLFIVSEDGTVHGARIQPIAQGGAMPDLVGSQQVELGGARTGQRGSDVCVIADATPVGVARRLPATPSVGDAPYYLRLAYQVWRPVSLSVFVDSGAGYPGVADHSIDLERGVGTSIAWLGPTAPRKVMLAIPARTTVCIARFDIVTLRKTS